MNRCKTKRWMALFTGVLIIATMILSSIPVYAELGSLIGDSAYIEKVTVPLTKNAEGLYDITVRFVGYDDEYNGSVAIIAPCSVTPKDVNGMTASIGDKVLDSKDVTDINGNPRTVCRFEIKFYNLVVPFGSNSFSMTVTRSDGKIVYFAKEFDYLGSNGNSSSGGLNPGTSDGGADDNDKETPIASLKPHLIVDSYSYGEAVAGKDVPVTFTLKNTSANRVIRNVVLTVKASGDLRIKSASDTIFVDSILPGKTITKSMNFFLGAGVKTDVQDISISSTFEYFDIEGRDAVAGGDNITISIPTDTVERVRIQKAELPEMLYPGSEEEITYSVINAGFNTLYNCEIKVVDEEGTEYAYAYVGSLDPSKSVSETYLPIVFDTPGEKNLKFVFTYENEKLQTGEVTRDFKASVMEMPIYEEPPINPFPEEPMPEEPQGMAPWLLWVLIGGGVLVAVIVTVVVIKAVKKKRGELDDEDI